MSDDVFRIVITVGVLVAAIGFVMQGIATFGMYRAVAKMRQKIEPIAERVPPLIATANAALEKARPVIERAGPAIAAAETTIAKAGLILEEAAPAVKHAKEILTNVNRIVEDVHPQIAEISHRAVEIADEGRDQVRHIGSLLADATERARMRLEQIDNTVENTVEQVEHAGDTIRHAVMRPVREVNGVAAGISAAVSSLVKGRKSSVDSATQDEEMFI